MTLELVENPDILAWVAARRTDRSASASPPRARTWASTREEKRVRKNVPLLAANLAQGSARRGRQLADAVRRPRRASARARAEDRARSQARRACRGADGGIEALTCAGSTSRSSIRGSARTCLPYGSPGAAGLDLRACIDAPLTLEPGATRSSMPSGIAIHLGDPGYAALDAAALGPRREAMASCSAIWSGLIDSDYQGQVIRFGVESQQGRRSRSSRWTGSRR